MDHYGCSCTAVCHIRKDLSVENPGKSSAFIGPAIGKGVDFFEDVMGKKTEDISHILSRC